MAGLSLSLGLGLGAYRSGGFSPRSLFAAGEPGAWYDPSDLSTMFQDTAGTTPVTATGQTVGLLLDKSKGLVLGSNLVANGDFLTNSDWFASSSWPADVVISGGKATVTYTTSNVGRIVSSAITGLTPGRRYVISADINPTSAFTVFLMDAAISNGGGNAILINTNGSSGLQTISGSFIATATTHYVSARFGAGAVVGSTFELDNVTFKELPGNHATQATAASRPIYGIEPFGGRRNLLTRTEQFDNAAWAKAAVTVTANAAAAPDGTTTADKVIATNTASATRAVYQGFTAPSTQNYTLSVYAKAAEYSRLALQEIGGGRFGATFDLSAQTTASMGGAGFVSSSITAVGDGWFRCSVVWSGVAAAGYALTAVGYPVGATMSPAGSAYAGDGTSGILIWGAQLETGSTATAYQRVIDQWNVTQAGVPSVAYVAFDGTDDFLVTPTITPGTDKAQVFAGVRQLTDATSCIAETSIDPGANAGTISLFAIAGADDVQWYSRGSTPASVRADVGTEPFTSVYSGLADISSDTLLVRYNGAQVGTSATDQGTGNFLAYPLYIGRRAGTALPFNGRMYGLITRFGANLTTDQITQTETWMNSKTGAY